MSSPRKPGHREGIPRNRRYGQLALVVRFPGREHKIPACVVCADKGCEFCPRVNPTKPAS